MKKIYSSQLKIAVKTDRLTGLGIDLLARKHLVPKTTIYYWIKDIPLPLEIENKIKLNSERGREQGREAMRLRRAAELLNIQARVEENIEKLPFNPELSKVMCSLLFWAEGGKDSKEMRFINSDPNMIAFFLFHFRNAFTLDESKFRVKLHLHDYHHHLEINQFWSEITQIPLSQFQAPYLKSHTGKMVKADYRGCVNLKYYDAKIAKELTALYTTLHLKHR